MFESIKARRVQHLLLYLGSIWAPGHQKQLLLLCIRGTLACVLILEVIESITALFWPDIAQVLQVIIVGGISVTVRFDAYFLIILYVEDYVPVPLALFDICVCFMDLVRYFYSGSKRLLKVE